jgi:protein-S-isoprenylcysteine O-methyltransferase Ste14
MGATDRGPGVRLPPPFIFVAGFVGGWLLNRRLEFLIDGDGPGAVQSAVGGTLVAAGLLLMASGIATFVRARTTVLPNRGARQLVTWGPYRLTRNPMYTGLATTYLGLTCLTNLAWPLVLLPFVIITMNVVVIRREEHYLGAIFGETYAEYCRRVRRWI